MSTVMRPAGPLPPKVYWVRRLVLVLVVVLLMSLAWWWVSGAGQANETSAGGPASGGAPTGPTVSAPATTSDSTPATAATGPQRHPTRTPSSPRVTKTRQAPTKPTRTPLAEPTGDCKPSGVDMKIDVGDSAPGDANTATLLLRSTDVPACTLAITPDAMTVRITSGNDVVWTSDDCPDALRAQQVVVRQDPPSAYQFRWNGQRSSENCQPVDSIPESGGYWVEAALIGGEPHKAYFDIKPAKPAKG